MDVKKPVILINLSSSSSHDITHEVTHFFERYGYGRPPVLIGESGAMEQMMDAMRKERGDILIGFGGDGTAAAVASIAREQNVPFIPLPGGTMNMLMQGLYASDKWESCLLRALSCAAPRPMTAAIVSDARGERGRAMVGCMFGKPTQMSEAREELRDGNVVDAVSGALGALRDTRDGPPLYFALDEGDYDGRPLELINVTCPFMDADATDPDALDISLFDTVTGASTISLGFNALLGQLREAKQVDSVRTRAFRLRADDTIVGVLDGEPHEFEGEVHVELVHDSGLVLAPAPPTAYPKSRPGDLIDDHEKPSRLLQ